MTLNAKILGAKVGAEFVGTTGLLIVVVGSGIMGENLSQGNTAIALLANSLATGAGLYALTQSFHSISGSHFNPVVSLLEWLQGKLTLKEMSAYMGAQFLGAISGVLVTHALFGQNLFQLSTHERGDFRFVFSEIIATFGLLMVISLSGKRQAEVVPASVSLFITSAYWCTSSTSFANPAVTVARSLTNTFSGILWTGVPGFIAAQFIGAVLVYGLLRFVLVPNK